MGCEDCFERSRRNARRAAEKADNLIEQIPEWCVTFVLEHMEAARLEDQTGHNVDAVLVASAMRLLENVGVMCELPHVSIADITESIGEA